MLIADGQRTHWELTCSTTELLRNLVCQPKPRGRTTRPTFAKGTVGGLPVPHSCWRRPEPEAGLEPATTRLSSDNPIL